MIDNVLFLNQHCVLALVVPMYAQDYAVQWHMEQHDVERMQFVGAKHHVESRTCVQSINVWRNKPLSSIMCTPFVGGSDPYGQQIHGKECEGQQFNDTQPMKLEEAYADFLVMIYTNKSRERLTDSVEC